MGCRKQCEKNIKALSEILNTDDETVYAMLLMTALLMDLHPEDDQVVQIILHDFGLKDVDDS